VEKRHEKRKILSRACLLDCLIRLYIFSSFDRVVELERNVKVLFGISLLSAFILGIFELLFPFYLDHIGISLVDMGLIFSVSSLIVSFLRIILGEYSDVYGRKKVYLASCAVGVAAKAFFPFSRSDLAVLGSKFLNDLQDNVRLSVHNVMLFENAKKAYARLFSWFTTSGFILQASGTILFAFLLACLGYTELFFLLAAVELAKLAIFLFYREDKHKELVKKVSVREAYSFKLNRNLKVLAVTSAISALGFGIAHGFLLPLYFVGKYGLDTFQISMITAIHRLAFLTTPLADSVIQRLGLRRTFIASTLAYVVSFLAVGLITFPIVVFVPIWLIHDLLGGGIGMTATNVMMQNLTDDETRGRQVNAYNAIQAPMTILAPGIAGFLAALSWDYLFVAGGLLYIVSLVFFCVFFKSSFTSDNSNT
jgi:MFS family permease